MWVGVVYLLRNIGIIEVIDWNIVWPVLIIIAGFAIRHCKRCGKCQGGMCMGGKCEIGKGDEHKCEGPECGQCK